MVTNPRLIPFPIASTTGELADGSQIVNDSTNQTGLLNNAANVQIALDRVDATGIGAPIFAFTGSYEATAANSSEWFNGQANRHLQGAAGQANGLRAFTLPGTSIMNTIMDTLSTGGLPELYRLTISYLGGVAGASVSVNRLNVVPRTTGNPQIDGRASVTLAHGDTATFEITRTASVLSDYNVIFEGRLQGSPAGDTLDDIQLQSQTWDATDGADLPTGVLQGYAYKVINAPTDGSGRFGEVLYTDDWVVWEAATFTQWSDTANWFVIAAGDVRRLTLAGQQFLEDVGTQTRNVRGAQFDGSAQDRSHWFRIYDQPSDYTPTDLNMSTDEGSITTATSRDNARLAIRFSGTNATIATLLTTLYAYEEDPFGNFHLIGNLTTDFTFEGDFGGESDYLARQDYTFHANSTIRLYFQTTQTLNTISDYDAVGNIDDGTITEEKLSTALRDRIGVDGPPNLALDEQRIAALEARQTTLFPLSPDVHKLTEWADIFEPEATTATVTEAPGYSLLVDYRGGGTRYASQGVIYAIAQPGAIVRYTGLGTNQYRTFGFRVAGAADETLLWLRDATTSIPFVRITAAGRIQMNNYIPATTQNQTIRDAFTLLTLTSGSATLTTSPSSVATYTLTRFPAGATNTSRSMQIDVDAILNGVDTNASHFINFVAPSDNTAQARQTVTSTINLGPLHGNRQVTVTIGYEFRVSGADLLVDITYITGPADITVNLRDVADLRTFTAPTSVGRVDQWNSFGDESGLYTLAGDTNFAITFQPHPSANTENAVAAVRNAAGTTVQLNDITVPIPEAGFDSVEIQTAGALPGSEFRSFAPDHFLTHSDVAALLPNSAQRWCYGLADERTVTEHAVTDTVDFTQGIILVSPDSSRWLISIDNAGTLTTTKQP